MLQTCCCLTAVTAFLPARLVISILTERIDRQRRKFDWTAKSGRVTASWPVLFPSVILMYDDHQLCVVVGHVGIGASRNGFTRPPTSRVLGFRLFSYSSGAESGENERDFIMADKLNGEKNWHISKGVTESSVAGSVASRQVAPSHRQELNYRPVEECRYMQMYSASIY